MEILKDRTIPKGKEYTKKHIDIPALVVGSHPCWEEDVKKALFELEETPIIFAVNAAGALVEADHMVTWHVEKLERFKKHYESVWGHGCVWHTGKRKTTNRGLNKVDYAWAMTPVGGTSAILAARIAKEMGCYPVILCGSPINGDGGLASTLKDDKNYWEQMNHGTRAWYKHIQHELKPKDKSGIFSMSGWTREEFGHPFPE